MAMRTVIGADGVRHPVSAEVEEFLAGLDDLSVRELVLVLASYSPEAMRALQLLATPDNTHVETELVRMVDAAISGVDLDYGDPFSYDEDDDDGIAAVDEVLDELERHLDQGAHPIVGQVLEHLLTRIGDLGQSSDNADALVSVAERACELYARAVEGHPDPTALARWILGFRMEYGWPSLTLATVAHALDDPAWVAYRDRVAALAGNAPAGDPYRDEVAAMLLELADHDGDTDAAVTLLSCGPTPYYGEIVGRLQAAGQTALALHWLDRAVAAHAVGHPWQALHTTVSAPVATRAYLDAGRPDAALAVARDQFAVDLSETAYRLLCAVADESGDLAEQRTWAIKEATSRAGAGGHHLIWLHLSDGNLTDAWAAADAHGAGQAWRELVDASEDDYPLRAARLCLAQAEAQLTTPNSKQYPSIVALLVRARSLYDKAGHNEEAVSHLIRLREAYRRRPALMAELNRAHLP